jgi:hypothetical protein
MLLTGETAYNTGVVYGQQVVLNYRSTGSSSIRTGGGWQGLHPCWQLPEVNGVELFDLIANVTLP